MMEKRLCVYQIPDDLIREILMRLPAKSLMRFKSVAKRWRTLIRDPNFAESHHLHRAQSRSDATSIFFCFSREEDNGHITTILASDIEGKVSSQLPVFSLRGYPCTNIVDGLMCFFNREEYELSLFNLTTREKLDFPCPTEEEKPIYRPPISQPRYLLLGFDPLTKRYKVLYFVSEPSGLGCLKDYCYIITIGSSSWRKIDYPEIAKWSRAWRRTICVNGAIYGIGQIKQKKEIQYFDVGEEKFHIVSDAKVVQGNHQFGSNLAAVSVIRRSDSAVFDLWSLNYNEKFWVKDELEFPDNLSLIAKAHVIGCNQTDEILLVKESGYREYLINYNFSKRTFRSGKIDWRSREYNDTREFFSFYHFRSQLPIWIQKSRFHSASSQVENILPLRSLC